MSKNYTFVLLCLLGMALMAVIGCSNDETNPVVPGGGGDDPVVADTTEFSMPDVGDIMRAAAPDVYVPPASSPTMDTAWTHTDYPLLDGIFGEDEPSTITRNIEDFENFSSLLDGELLVDENGVIVPGTFNVTLTPEETGAEFTMHITLVVTNLTSATAVPAAQQAMFGSSWDLNTLVRLTLEEVSGGYVNIGLNFSETAQNMVVYTSNMSGMEGQTESMLSYLSLNPADSAFTFNGCMYTSQEGGQYPGEFNMSYKISSQTAGEFGYSSSWTNTGQPSDTSIHSEDGLGSMWGGGDKHSEFAMKFNQYFPRDAVVADTAYGLEQVFTATWGDGTALVSAFSSYLNDSQRLVNAVVPSATVADPWAE